MSTNSSPPSKKHKYDRDPGLSMENAEGGSEIEIQTESKESGSEQTENLALEKKVSDLKEEISSLKGRLALISPDCKLSEMDEMIEALHEYNDIKDVTQMLLGKLADFDEVTTSSLYSRFGLDTSD